MRRLWSEKIDLVVDLEFFSRFTSLFSLLIRSPYRVGFYNRYNSELRRGNFLTHPVLFNEQEHTAVSYLSLINALDMKPEKQLIVKKTSTFENMELTKISSDEQQINEIHKIFREQDKVVTKFLLN